MLPPPRKDDPPPGEDRAIPNRDAGVDRADGANDELPPKLRPLMPGLPLKPRWTPRKVLLPVAVRAKLLAFPWNDEAEFPWNEEAELPWNAVELPWKESPWLWSNSPPSAGFAGSTWIPRQFLPHFRWHSAAPWCLPRAS